MHHCFRGILFRNRTKKGCEDNLLSLLDDGTNPGILDYYNHSVLQKSLFYLIETGKRSENCSRQNLKAAVKDLNLDPKVGQRETPSTSETMLPSILVLVPVSVFKPGFCLWLWF